MAPRPLLVLCTELSLDGPYGGVKNHRASKVACGTAMNTYGFAEDLNNLRKWIGGVQTRSSVKIKLMLERLWCSAMSLLQL